MENFAEEPQVMIVDDIPGTREIIRDMLQEIGFTRITEAGDGREALEKLKGERAQLIICDYVMKDMSGLDLLHQLRNHPYLVDVPFIMVSAVGDVPVIEAALNLGASDFIVKPISFQLLRRKITDVLRRKMSGT
jgi:two-component system, chemotaxis family, chemotaxis protein CheY